MRIEVWLLSIEQGLQAGIGVEKGLYPMVCQGPKCSGFQAEDHKTSAFQLIISQQ